MTNRINISELVDADRGMISRELFSSEEIYQQELEQIFARCWLFLCHETQIPNAGDFFSTSMGEDPVLVVRQRDGSIKALLNSCRHRGMKVCRADMGNAKAFTCTYHGWAYDESGALVSVPNLEDGYFNQLDMDQWGMVSVAQLEVYKGLVFATFDPTIPPLLDYIGDMRFYLDAFVDRLDGGSEVIGGYHRWIVPCNWKFAAEQFSSDMYHAPITHVSAFRAMSQGTGRAEEEAVLSASPLPGRTGKQFSSAHGHGTGFFEDYGQGFRTGWEQPLVDHYEKHWDELEKNLGEPRTRGPMASHATIFPSFSYLATSNTLRVWQPLGPGAMVVQAWILVDKSMTPEAKDAQRTFALRTVSGGGMVEQDDGEAWADIQKVFRGAVQKRYPFNYQMGLGRYTQDHEDYPGRINYVMSDGAARGFYRRYAQLMDAETWPENPPVAGDTLVGGIIA
jgi:phenylpropionate dioxygenase-like ring-hydroxylating dioxygenase large terminal subunit